MDDESHQSAIERESVLRAQRLRQRRESLGLTIRETAKRVGVFSTRYVPWERNLSDKVATEHLAALAKALDVSESWLYSGPAEESAERSDYLPKSAVKLKPLNTEIRQLLSQRAKTRREAIGLSIREVADAIGVHPATVRNWETDFPRWLSQAESTKWEDILRVTPGWLRETTVNPTEILGRIHLISDSEEGRLVSSAPEVHSLRQVSLSEDTISQEIRAIGAWLSRRALAHRTTLLDTLSLHERRTADIFAQRYGVAGDDRSILQEVGNEFSLTRERVRQIVDKALDRAQGVKFDTPRLDSLGRDIQELLPIGLEDADARFRDLLGENLSLQTVDVFAREVLGKSFYSVTGRETGPGVRFKRYLIPVSGSEDGNFRLIRDKAREMIRATGAAHTFFVAGAAGDELGQGITPAEVVRAIRLVPGFDWLNETDGWFWLGEEPENRLLNAAKKMLVVANGRLDVQDILSGVVRSRRHSSSIPSLKTGQAHAIEPPWEIVRTILQRTSWCKTVQHNDFVLTGEFKEEDVLSDVERRLCASLRAQGGVAAFGKLKKEFAQAGLVKNTGLSILLANSPIVYRPEFGLVAIRGIPIRSAALERARNEVGIQIASPEKDFPDDEGFFHLEAEFTPYIAKGRFWDVPQRLARHLEEGDYVLHGFDEPVEIKRLQSGGTRLNKFVGKIISIGMKPGDRLDVAINPEERIVRIVSVLPS